MFGEAAAQRRDSIAMKRRSHDKSHLSIADAYSSEFLLGVGDRAEIESSRGPLLLRRHSSRGRTHARAQRSSILSDSSATAVQLQDLPAFVHSFRCVPAAKPKVKAQSP